MSDRPAPPAPVVAFERRWHVGVITLQRPHRGNAWTGRMELEFRQIVADADADDQVAAIVVTGAGAQFCVGADVKALEMSSEAGTYQSGISTPLARPGDPEDRAIDTRFGFLRALNKPVIAAVNGAAAGIGFVLMCFADIRFVADGAKLTAAAPRLGLPAECGISWMLPRLIGWSRATEILLSSRVVLGSEAAAIGLAHAAVPAGDVLATALEYADRLVSECAPSSLSATKRQLGLDMERSLVEADADADRRLDMVGSAEFREGTAALRDKRPPEFWHHHVVEEQR